MNKTFKYCLILILILIFSSKLIFAENEKAQIIAAYINNFVKYTTWQNENQLDSFRIVVITKSSVIDNEFKKYISNRKLKNKPISLKVVPNIPSLEKVNLILLTKDCESYLLNLYNLIEGKPILLVTEDYPEKRDVMINLYQTAEGKLKFELNEANIINQNLSIDPEVLLAGGTSIDVASLYRKSQLKMRDMQKIIDSMSDSLFLLNNNIQKAKKEISEKQREINGQIIEIDSHKQLIQSQKSELIEYINQFNFQKKILENQQDSIRETSNILLKQKEDINKHSNELKEQLNELESKEKQIFKLNSQIKSKNIALDYQSDKILRQTQLIYALAIIGLLVIFLIIAIYLGYRNHKKNATKLALKKAEIEEKLIELEQLNSKLKEADQYKSIFLASMSHELRTPLNSIIGYTGILLMGMAGDLNDEQKNQLTKVKNNGSHLLNLINEVLDISKIEAGKAEFEYEEFQLKALITEIIDIVYLKAKEKKLELNHEVPEDFYVFSDKRRIKQVILNLVSNAVNYTNEGSVSVKSVKIYDNRLKVSVIDTGIGIPKEDIARLFQPFQQIDSSLTKHNKGTGLGLYLSRKLLKQLDGDIFVKSENGKGSEFYIEIPFKINK
ncbi:MAG TPA: YfiR/HmsC family protein [Candidatus Kapabacteria bacterium]|nr:YfiR/HmsC family protein [Candidatus Kapabacteria bacterium]